MNSSGDRYAQLLGLGVLLPRVAEPGRRDDQVAGLAVVRLVGDRLALGDVPDVPVADGGHVADLDVLAGERLGVAGPPAAVDVPAVEHPVVLLVDPATCR